MLFPTFTFFAFFTVVLTLNWFLKKNPLWWRIFLLLISYFFYATWDVRFVFLLLAVTLFNFYSARLIKKIQEINKQQILIAVAVGVNVLLLGFFKYYDFFRASAENFLKALGFSNNLLFLNIILPVGLSFYILRAISYNIDVYRKEIEPAHSLLDFSIYIAFFPQLLSGPIMRAKEFLPQLKDGGAQTIDNLHECFSFILGGLFKKVVIASYLIVRIVDDVFAVPQSHSPLVVLLAIYAYAVVIYCDFSGYSDIAVGIARLMGFKSPENFNTPYLALNLQDFWRRWHITLSNWLRDYVYIPLGGNRKGRLRKYLNLMITMFISGLWHGTGIHYVFWGLFHGAGLVANQCVQETNKPVSTMKHLNILEKLSSWFITFNFVCFSWIFFRAESMADAFNIIKQLLSRPLISEPIELYTVYLIIISLIIFLAENKIKNLFIYVQEKLPFILQVLLITLLVILLLKVGPDIIPPFIYFKF